MDAMTLIERGYLCYDDEVRRATKMARDPVFLERVGITHVHLEFDKKLGTSGCVIPKHDQNHLVRLNMVMNYYVFEKVFKTNCYPNAFEHDPTTFTLAHECTHVRQLRERRIFNPVPWGHDKLVFQFEGREYVVRKDDMFDPDYYVSLPWEREANEVGREVSRVNGR